MVVSNMIGLRIRREPKVGLKKRMIAQDSCYSDCLEVDVISITELRK